MDSLEEIQAIHNEVADESTPAKTETQTFSAKWLSRAYRLCIFWNWFAVSVFVSQVLILVILQKEFMIPGATAIYTSAGVITGALVGGEKIVANLKKGNT